MNNFMQKEKDGNNAEKVLGLRELATALGLSYWTVWKWQKEGKIPTIRLGKNKLFFRVSAVEARLTEIEAASMEKTGEVKDFGTLRRID